MRPTEEVAAERAKVATEGWGARLLARQEANGRWGGDPDNPEWTCLLSLLWLRDMGLDPSSTEARRAVALIRDNVTWHWWDNKPFFEGEVEPCINGRVVSVGSYFRQDVRGLVDRLLGEQMDDGGWNCEQEHGSTRGSFHTTINVLEGLAEHERATGGSPAVTAARERGQEYLLERRTASPAFDRRDHRSDLYRVLVPNRLLLRRPAGAGVSAACRGPAGRADDRGDRPRRARSAARTGGGRLENPHPEQLDLGMDEAEGQPSRWNTLRALRVLDWYSARD